MKIETTWKSTPLGEKTKTKQRLSPFCTIQPPCSSLVLSFLFYFILYICKFVSLLLSSSFTLVCNIESQ
jgi:hypothetical protein